MSLIATSQDDAASSIGVDRRTFHRWLKEGCPGRKQHYVIRDIVEWARENKWNEEGSLIEGATGEDTDLKTLLLKEKTEKTRHENELLRFKIDTQYERLVDADLVWSVLIEKAGLIRNGLERLERQFGPDALDIVIEVLDELERVESPELQVAE